MLNGALSLQEAGFHPPPERIGGFGICRERHQLRLRACLSARQLRMRLRENRQVGQRHQIPGVVLVHTGERLPWRRSSAQRHVKPKVCC